VRKTFAPRVDRSKALSGETSPLVGDANSKPFVGILRVGDKCQTEMAKEKATNLIRGCLFKYFIFKSKNLFNYIIQLYLIQVFEDSNLS